PAGCLSQRPAQPRTREPPEIPAEYALQGFEGVRAYSHDPDASRAFLEGTLEFDPQGENGWEVRGENRGGFYRYDRSDERGIPGAGTVHQVAWASPMHEHEGWPK